MVKKEKKTCLRVKYKKPVSEFKKKNLFEGEKELFEDEVEEFSLFSSQPLRRFSTI